ncbi:molybdopterin molybdotransferase MoeA [Limimaricola cinnabarinus]|uniref:Molybdopterin molybdenumtransferase n=1 Tax=Limimaricola cinnabarinus TaxID=1125964 RepID=A0A2G1MEZ1_9RHOB|nr:gephyrin-like molybdotransferase Glp [Limimaricola cinnabarinus]PHP27308.1 molybdopterin molybdenumtransferase MoeA [Limimaricola cinnabarinus]
MIPVGEALDRLFSLVSPLPTEEVALTAALGRVLRTDVTATRDQPPFAASAMDGYAIREADLAPGAVLRVIGEAAAGHGYAGHVGPGEALRIFTGAPVPEGAGHVVMQEDTTREGERITLGSGISDNRNIRPAGVDFRAGDALAAPRRLTPADIALAASMNADRLTVSRRPEVAIIATGDELVAPGGDPRDDQIIASNAYGLHGIIEQAGGTARLLPIAGDSMAALAQAFDQARGADIVLTIGGASVGDHDLVGDAAAEAGMERAFWKVALRPGKPLMAGRFGEALLLGLPGNPVSSMVCAHVFLVPLIRALSGLPPAPAPRRLARLAAPLAANGPREHYLRAVSGPDGVTAFSKQDSSLLSVLSEADCLIVQPPGDRARDAGETVEVIAL